MPNLPLTCWGSDSLSRIGTLIGTSLFVGKCTTSQERISFARFLVEVDVTRELPKVVTIQNNAGVSFEQKIM